MEKTNTEALIKDAEKAIKALEKAESEITQQEADKALLDTVLGNTKKDKRKRNLVTNFNE